MIKVSMLIEKYINKNHLMENVNILSQLEKEIKTKFKQNGDEYVAIVSKQNFMKVVVEIGPILHRLGFSEPKMDISNNSLISKKGNVTLTGEITNTPEFILKYKEN